MAAVYLAQQTSAEEAGKAFGVPKRTVARWVNTITLPDESGEWGKIESVLLAPAYQQCLDEYCTYAVVKYRQSANGLDWSAASQATSTATTYSYPVGVNLADAKAFVVYLGGEDPTWDVFFRGTSAASGTQQDSTSPTDHPLGDAGNEMQANPDGRALQGRVMPNALVRS